MVAASSTLYAQAKIYDLQTVGGDVPWQGTVILLVFTTLAPLSARVFGLAGRPARRLISTVITALMAGLLYWLVYLLVDGAGASELPSSVVTSVLAVTVALCFVVVIAMWCEVEHGGNPSGASGTAAASRSTPVE